MGHYIVWFSKYVHGEKWFLPLNVFSSEKNQVNKEKTIFRVFDTGWKLFYGSESWIKKNL